MGIPYISAGSKYKRELEKLRKENEKLRNRIKELELKLASKSLERELLFRHTFTTYSEIHFSDVVPNFKELLPLNLYGKINCHLDLESGIKKDLDRGSRGWLSFTLLSKILYETDTIFDFSIYNERHISNPEDEFNLYIPKKHHFGCGPDYRILEVEDLKINYMGSDYVLAVDLELYKVGSPKLTEPNPLTNILEKYGRRTEPEEEAKYIVELLVEDPKVLKDAINLGRKMGKTNYELMPIIAAYELKFYEDGEPNVERCRNLGADPQSIDGYISHIAESTKDEYIRDLITTAEFSKHKE